MTDERRRIAGLTCAEWNPGGSPVILALHGLTSTSEVWRGFAESVPQARVIAPDLPGRAGSAGAASGPGLAGHAAAVVRVADELGLDDVVVLGHSMGAFLAPLVAAALGDRVRRVVLVDGGAAPEQTVLVRRPVVRALFRLQTRILARRWRDVDAYVNAMERRAIAGRPELRPRLLQWATYLLDGPPGALRARIDRDRLLNDAVDTLTGAASLPALAGLPVPVHLIAAEHGKDDRAKPFLSDQALAAGRATLPRLTAQRVGGNHLTMLFDPALAAAATRPI